MLLLRLALGLDFALSFLLPQAAILWKRRTSLFFIGDHPDARGNGLSFIR